jgi:hypothetical protein
LGLKIFFYTFKIYDFNLIIIYLAALGLIALESYLISSPVFYPRVPWWEYDFRYRGDLKINVSHKGENLEGRLTDLRRGAGCVLLFENIEIQDEVSIYPLDYDIGIELIAEIKNKREELVGRGISYGVKFVFNSEEQEKQYKRLTKLWTESKIIKKRHKFKKT